MARQPSDGQRRRPGRPPKEWREGPCQESKAPAVESPPGHHFFRVILQKIIEDKKLRIPLRLVNRSVGSAQLSDMARLCVLMEMNGNFEYKGNSRFNVIIFDPSNSEITEYGKNEEETRHENQETECDDFGEETKLYQTKGTEIPSTCKNDNNKRKVEVFCCLQYRRLSEMKSLSKGSKKAILAADLFEPTYPAFKVLLRPYNFTPGASYVPSSFVERYMKRVHEEVRLESPDGKRWSVRVTDNGYGLNFSYGWKSFSNYINLKDGDVVIFQMINSKDFLLKIKVFRS
ncbi:hypothetical protein JCGZ_02503 [Jatropha curcas]|uniref:TF-B3 domain-containing protein n=1 Tax=Jatropha curcas TaxID=180498 RepID=A0A067JFI4_JATCU|nr:hypothetical protein JCGZ_02503 [Jatropha curcas]